MGFFIIIKQKPRFIPGFFYCMKYAELPNHWRKPFFGFRKRHIFSGSVIFQLIRSDGTEGEVK